jgi:hypothetical protein
MSIAVAVVLSQAVAAYQRHVAVWAALTCPAELRRCEAVTSTTAEACETIVQHLREDNKTERRQFCRRAITAIDCENVQ